MKPPILFALLLIACCSCGTSKRYVEPTGSMEPVAIAQATPPVWLNSIDGRKTPKGFGQGMRQFRLAPGKHVIEVGFGGVSREMVKVGETYRSEEVVRSLRSKGRVPWVIRVQPGWTYSINHEILDRGRTVKFFIPPPRQSISK